MSSPRQRRPFNPWAHLLPPAKEWAERTRPDRPLAEALADPVWRIANIYTIFDKKRKRFVPFVPKPEQQIVIWDLYVRGIKNLIIPKARQIGFSTLLALIALDMVMWNTGAKCALVDKTKEDAMKKMADIVRVAWDKLPNSLRAVFAEPVLNATEFAVSIMTASATPGQPDSLDGWSRFRVEKSGRGDALTFLWISEWGTIQFEEPKRSEEIRTGGMPAAEGGIRVIETTWKGADGGDVWPYVQMALEKDDSKKNPALDWYIRFFPWWIERTYTEAMPQGCDEAAAWKTIRPAILKYLREKEAEISDRYGQPFAFTIGQALWYDRTEKTCGILIKREYPTMLEECWEAPVEGAVYADLVAQAGAEGRVQRALYVPGAPVYTLWDLGSPENFVVWYFQIIAGQIRFIDIDMKLWLTTQERVDRMKGKGYTFARHYLPHDAGSMKTSVLTFRGELIAAGLEGTVVVPVTRDTNLGINRTRILFHLFAFDSDKCAQGLKSLRAYHYHEKTFEAVHDWSSHAADALRVLAEADSIGILPIAVNRLASPTEHLRWFDPDGLEVLRNQVVSAEPRTQHGTLDHGVWSRTPTDESWLRVWQNPHFNGSYLVTLKASTHEREPDALQVWKNTPGTDRLEQVAALEDLAVDLQVLARWASDVSAYYGGAIVVPAIDGQSGMLEALEAAGASSIYTRDQPREHRRVGQGKRLRKRGYELTPEAQEHALARLRDAVREQRVLVQCPLLLAQLEQWVQLTPEHPPGPAPGNGGSLVLAAAMAHHCANAATLMVAPQREIPLRHYANSLTPAEGGQFTPAFEGDCAD